MIRPVLLALAAALSLAAAFALAGCGEKTEPSAGGARKLEPFTLVLDYVPNADHAGIYTAQADGEFARAGLQVKIVTPPDPSAPLKLLQAGRADLAISYEPELLLARDKGTRLLSVGALVQTPLTTLMSIGGSGVKTADDLRGKTVGTAGIPYQTAYLKTILAKAGVPDSSVKRVDVGFNLVPAMISKRVDATLGAFWNVEGVDLAARGKKPTILRMEKLGVPTYDELVLVARRNSLHQAESSKIRRFLQALSRGTAKAVADPQAAATALVTANPDLDARRQLAQIRATGPVFEPQGKDQPYGFQDQAAWHRYGQWMYANHLLDADPAAEDALTNEFLPGQGVASNTAQP
ncbi:MAG: putative hydroxymethylpyrimidine transport system substrate-binding protein [Solirubrobacteraceae bacterium]|nr:putative hydroxymethylpyrimidine transport system substrate-binding protein [Solirubrobacteraceae bacterium]